MEKYIFHKIKQVQALDDYKLKVKFLSDECKIYDLSQLGQYSDFKILLSTPQLFKNVKVSQGGYGIEWNDKLDISCNELYYNGKVIDKETR